MVEYSFSSRRRRSLLSIMAEILDVAKEGSLKTQILYRANLTFKQVNEYLLFLLDSNLLRVTENPEKTIYKTTDKGLRYLQSYREIRELLKNGNNMKEANSLNLAKRGTRVILL